MENGSLTTATARIPSDRAGLAERRRRPCPGHAGPRASPKVSRPVPRSPPHAPTKSGPPARQTPACLM